MAIANKYPTIRPSLNLDFANSKTIDPRITFTRASSATYFDEKGVMRTAPAGVPRIDYAPVTGECNGLLIEEQRTNLLAYSEQFDNAAWPKSNATVTPNATVAPDGTPTADKLVENTATATHYAYQGITTPANTTYTFSIYAKAAERTRVSVTTRGVGWVSGVVNIFDLTNGSVVTGAGVVTNVGNGWYRISVTDLTDGTVQFRGLLVSTASGASQNFLGDGTSGIYIWGAQREVGSFPTSYIKTEASQVTRAADDAVMTGTNFSDWANSVGTVLAKYKTAGWKHNNTPPVTQLDLTKAVDNYSTPITSDGIQRAVFYPRQLTADQITALKG